MNTLLPTPLIPIWYVAIPTLVAVVMLYRVRHANTPVTVGSNTFQLLRLSLTVLLFPILVHLLRMAVPGDGNNTAGLLLLASLLYMLPRFLPVALPHVSFRTGVLAILALLVVDALLMQFWFTLPLPPAILPEFTADLVVVGLLWLCYFAAMQLLKQPVLKSSAHDAPQQNELTPLTAEDKILQAAQAYLSEGETLQIQPTVPQFTQWLGELAPIEREHWVAIGMLATWQQSFSFRRFVWQQKGFDYAGFLASRLDTQTFQRWVDATYA